MKLRKTIELELTPASVIAGTLVAGVITLAVLRTLRRVIAPTTASRYRLASMGPTTFTDPPKPPLFALNPIHGPTDRPHA